MGKPEIKISGHVQYDVEKTFAGTLEGAVKSFKREHPLATIECIDDELVVSWCEVCGVPLFEDSEAYWDSEGVTWCKSHGK